jgi:phosphate acyltransferase
MGTDRHPAVEVEGAVQALRELPGDFELLLVGDARGSRRSWRGTYDPAGGCGSCTRRTVIEPGEPAVTAARRKPTSSIVVGLKLQKEGEADAFVSAGSTGAVMAASLFLFRAAAGRGPAGDRHDPADDGAAVPADRRGRERGLQAAAPAAVRAAGLDLCGGRVAAADAAVGLLNIGEEPEKGDELTVEAHRLLRASDLNFVGNIEGRDVIRGICDVLVADGFVGNVLLKFYESVMGFMHGLLTTELASMPGRADLDRLFRASTTRSTAVRRCWA